MTIPGLERMHRLFSTLSPTTYALALLRLCLILCALHGVALLTSAIIGFHTGSILRFTYNVEGLKSLFTSLSLSFLSVSLVQHLTKTK